MDVMFGSVFAAFWLVVFLLFWLIWDGFFDG